MDSRFPAAADSAPRGDAPNGIDLPFFAPTTTSLTGNSAPFDAALLRDVPPAPGTPLQPDPDRPFLSEHPAWLFEQDFVDGQPTTTRPPGPGLPEAVGWCVGFHVVQVFLGVAVLLGVLAVALFTNQADGDDLAGGLEQRFQAVMLPGVQFLMVFVVFIATRLRLGAKTRPLLRPASLSLGHAALVALLVLPLSILSTQVYNQAEVVWQMIVDAYPALSAFDDVNSMDMLDDVIGQLPLIVLVLTIGFVPAFTEELVFRGVIGRGLVARWGVVAGVLMTSFLFAIVHLHPAHAAGVFLLGGAMHLCFLATRSILAPMLLHFLNNSMAVVAAKLTAGDPTTETADSPTSWIMVAASLFVAAAVAYAMWRTRVRFQLGDGTTWSGADHPLDRLPAGTTAIPVRTRGGVAPVALVLASCGCFVAAAFTPDDSLPAKASKQGASAAVSENAR